MKKKVPIFDPIDKYIHWFITKFTLITKKARLTLEWLAKMIIIYPDGLRQNYFARFFLGLWQTFSGKMLFVVIVALKN